MLGINYMASTTSKIELVIWPIFFPAFLSIRCLGFLTVSKDLGFFANWN